MLPNLGKLLPNEGKSLLEHLPPGFLDELGLEISKMASELANSRAPLEGMKQQFGQALGIYGSPGARP